MSTTAPVMPAPAPVMATVPPLVTAEEFTQHYANRRAELVRGRVKELLMPFQHHGRVCYRVTMALGSYVEPRDLGHVTTNDSWVLVRRNPDTVLGSDVCYFSYDRLPKGAVPTGLVDAVPELVIEVLSPSDRWTEMIAKALDYMAANVLVVILLDPKTKSASVFRPEGRHDIFEADDTLRVPELLPAFAVPVRPLFE